LKLQELKKYDSSLKVLKDIVNVLYCYSKISPNHKCIACSIFFAYV